MTHPRLTDIHCHILYGVDDGPKTISESMEMIRKASEHGVVEICMTPHLFLDNPPVPYEMMKKTELIQNNFREMRLHFGFEIMMDDKLPEFVKKNCGCCLGDGRCVLIELPMFNYPLYVKDVLYKLRSSDFIPIIAHPERNTVIQGKREGDCCADIIENGFIQVNAGSITGRYGAAARETAEMILKKGLVSYVSSDSHHPDGYEHFAKAYSRCKRILGKDQADLLFFVNPGRAIEGREPRKVGGINEKTGTHALLRSKKEKVN